MILEHLVIQRMGDSEKDSKNKDNHFNKDELAALLKFGVSHSCSEGVLTYGRIFSHCFWIYS